MSQGRIPKPYVNDVKVDDGLMVYVPFPKMDIGARQSGLPPSASTGPKSLEHVGQAEGRKAPKKDRR